MAPVTGVGEPCGVCGWPTTLATCPMCGQDARSVGFDASRAPQAPGGLRPEDFPDLKDAFMAWKAGAYEDMVERTLAVLGVTERSPTAPQGTIGWTVTVDSAALYVAYDRARLEITAEAPVVRVPQHERVGLMRTLLELNLWAFDVARFCLHGDVVVLRFADRGENVSPPKLVAAIREVGREADRHDNWLSEKFGARMVGPEAQRARLEWSFLGTPVELMGFEQAETASDAADRNVDAVTGLLRVLEQARDLIRAHDPNGDGVAARLICRAAICRAWSEFRSTCPTAATLVLDGGWPVILAPLGQEESVIDVLGWLERLRTLGDRLNTLAPAPVPPMPAMQDDVRRYVSLLLADIARVPQDPVLLHFLLLGGIAELLARAPVQATQAQSLRHGLKWARDVQASASSCQQLTTILKGLV